MRLFEFTPSRTQFSQILADESLRMGFECEVMLPESSDDDDERELDSEAENERIDNMSWSEVEGYTRGRQRDNINDAYMEWIDEKTSKEWNQIREEVVKEYCQNQGLLNGEEDHDEEVLEDSDNVDQAEEEWRENNDFYNEFGDMDDFINEEYRSMSRFVYQFDIEIEPDDSNYHSNNSSTESLHQAAAQELEDAIGDEVYTRFEGHDNWYVTEDASLSGEGTGMEIVSPVLSMSDGLNDLNIVFNWIKESASTNKSTGLHVSFSIEGKNENDYDYLKMIMLFDENYTAKLFKRMSNGYAQQMRTLVFTNLNKITDINKMPERSIRLAVDRLRQISESVHNISAKYFSFRHRSNGVFEFRSMGNQGYENRFDVIRKRIIAMAAIMKVGSDPDMMAKEYLSRIYRMLTSEKFSSTEATPKIEPPAILSSFATMPRLLIKLANDDPKNFLAWLATEAKAPLKPTQIRQLRMYVRKHGLRPDMYDGLKRTHMDRYNVLASYLKWPTAIRDENGQVVDDRQRAFPFPMNSEQRN